MTKTKSTRKCTVGTVKKSQATMSVRWLFRKDRHVGDDGILSRGRYASTVDLATSMPILWSSPTMRGEPHVGLQRHISWMSSRTALATVGRPGLPLTLKRPQ